MTSVLLGDASQAAAGTRLTLESEHDIVVLDVCRDGKGLIDRALALQPDVIVTDVDLEGGDAVAAIRGLMASNPLPLLLFGGGVSGPDAGRVRDALAAGAADVLPGGPASLPRLRDSVRRLALQRSRAIYGPRRGPARHTAAPRRPRLALVVFGASTGGPLALGAVFRALPPSFDLPIVVGQHIGTGFVHSLASTLGVDAGRRVRVVGGRERVESRTLYLAADGASLHIPTGGWVEARAVDGGHPRDSITRLFASAAAAYGARAAGVLLTGMGRDGAAGLLDLRRAGGWTIAQSPATCVVDGMPQAAIDLGAAEEVLTLEDIGRALEQMRLGPARAHR